MWTYRTNRKDKNEVGNDSREIGLTEAFKPKMFIERKCHDESHS